MCNSMWNLKLFMYLKYYTHDCWFHFAKPSKLAHKPSSYTTQPCDCVRFFDKTGIPNKFFNVSKVIASFCH